MHDPYLIEAYSSEWYLMNTMSLIGILFFLGFFYVLFNHKYFKSRKLENKVTKFLGCLLLTRLLVYHSYAISTGVWDINHSLPFHLCGISSLLCIGILFRYNQLIYEFLILLGAPGALWSFLTPEIHISEPWYMYFDYFLSHSAIIFVPVYLTICLNKKPRALSYCKIFIIVNIFVVPIVGIINILIKNISNSDIVNYMYLMRPPQAENPFIVEGWMYVLVMEITAFMHMFLIYSIFMLFNKFRKAFTLKERFA